MKDGVKASYIALFATSFATVRSSYNTGAASRLHFSRNSPVRILHFTLSKVSYLGTSLLKGSPVWMLRPSKVFPSTGLILSL